jgi:hypothetical protein
MTRGIFFCFIYLVLVSACNSNSRSHQFLNQIRKAEHIRFLTDTAFVMSFRDSSEESQISALLRNYLTENEVKKMMRWKSPAFRWQNSQLDSIQCVDPSTMQKANVGKKPEQWISICSVSAPIYNNAGTLALLRIVGQVPDPEGSNVFYGDECFYIFQNKNGKWEEVIRENCINY